MVRQVAGTTLVPGRRARLSRPARRDQLLDVAAAIVVEQGTAAVTIERLAGAAGVSRALAYQHFENAADALLALYQREVAHLAAEVVTAIDHAVDPAARFEAAVGAYLDVVAARGALLGALMASRAEVVSRADGGKRLGHRFVEGLFTDIFGLTPAGARTVAAVFLGALNGGVEAWAAGELERAEVEQAVVAVGLHLAERSQAEDLR